MFFGFFNFLGFRTVPSHGRAGVVPCSLELVVSALVGAVEYRCNLYIMDKRGKSLRQAKQHWKTHFRRAQLAVRQSHEDVHMVHRTFSLVFRCTRDPSPYYDGYQRSPYGSVGYMGICMWNTGNMENTDYGQMGITEDYLMWFSFMYGLQSDYYLVFLILLIPTSHYLYLVRSGHLFVSCLSFHLFSCDF